MATHNMNIYEIHNDMKIFDHNPSPSFSKNIDFPKFTLGFQHFFHQSKLKLEILKQFENKKKIYLVMSEYETLIDDYDNTIDEMSMKYFNIKTNITSASFYKLWEMYFLFDIIDLNDNDYTTVLLDESNADVLRSVMLFREKYGKKNKNNKYASVFVNDVKKENKNQKLEFSIENSIGKSKANLIITNGFKNVSNNLVMEEQDVYTLILNQIIYSLKNLTEGGTFICKIYESFTNITSKILACLSSFFDKMYIVKPLTSRQMSSEKYIVCYKFKKNPNQKNINKLETIIEDIDKNKNKNLVNIFPDYEIDNDFKNSLILSNIKISNKQFININEIISFINKQNYRGYEYDTKRQLQIDATTFWLETFFIETKDYDNTKKKLLELCDKIVKNNVLLLKK
jgi:hypothetical protein